MVSLDVECVGAAFGAEIRHSDPSFSALFGAWLGAMVELESVKPVRKWPLATAGVAVLVYSIVVLGFVAKSRDIGLRCLLTSANDGTVETVDEETELAGIRIDRLINVETNGVRPREGDTLLSIAKKPIGSFTDFTQAMAALSTTPTEPGAILREGGDAEEWDFPIVEIEEDGPNPRWIQVKYLRIGSDSQDSTVVTSSLKEHSLPLGALSLSLVWFVLHLGIFLVGAMAYWKRPLDSSARMFFAMCIVTVPAFVGGYHWWVISARLWLNVPFAVCAMLVPVVTLHFFLVFPHRKPWFAKHPRTVVAVLYTLPLIATAGMVALLCYAAWQHSHPQVYTLVEQRHTLKFVQSFIYGYLTVASVYFLATLVALYDSYRTTRNTTEHDQVKWILWAAAASLIPVGYTLYLAYANRVEFAVGHARIPMFVASLLFMLAYAVGIVRYKLMLLDQVFSRGILYLVFSFGVLITYSLAITLCSLLGMSQNEHFLQHAISVTPVVLVSVILLGWVRDRIQQALDRRFYREKYQLDKVLQGMNQAVAHLVDPATLGRQMLDSCRDVLQVNQAALYLRSSSDEDFKLIACEGRLSSPEYLANDPEIAAALLENPSLQRATFSTGNRRSPVQDVLHNLEVDLIHGLEMEGDLAGIVLLGPKRDGSPFTAEDLTFLAALGQIMTLHSSKVHYEITRLNNELSLKIERVAEQQRQISILQSEIMGSRRQFPAVTDANFQNKLIRGDSPALQRVLETVRKVSHSESSVLIRGESGTGKELLAQTLHENSPRRTGPLVRVHCAALSPSLLESELFGHTKGSFTGAHRDKEGRFEMANGGTLFLDEIGDISLETQVKLLRVLQERAFEPVGGTRTVHVDVRLVTATHQDLEQLILDGRFREDLYYRLNVISITLPPLRERREDIFELTMHFMLRAAQRMGKPISDLTPETIEILKRYPWPGNIRELENVIERAVVLADGEVITPDDLPREIVHPQPSQLQLGERRSPFQQASKSAARSPAPDRSEQRAAATSAAEWTSEEQRLRNALAQCDGNKARAARLLGMPRSTYYSRLKKYRIS